MDLGDLLAAAGYTRQDPVDESGEFCVRGGVVDFYPAGANQPLRLEFMGDTIESIRSYDPSTQRSTAVLDQAAVAPLQELIATDPDNEAPDRSSTIFDYLRIGQRADRPGLRAGRGPGSRGEADPADRSQLSGSDRQREPECAAARS